MENKDISFQMAIRLKQLREEHGLSHQKLSDSLAETLDVEISKDSLIKYEVATDLHSTPYKNLGMRVEYLLALATFYNVSTDYLLGFTDTRSPSIETQAIVAQTGLTEKNALLLEGLHSLGSKISLDLLNDLISVSIDSNMLMNYLLMKSTLTVSAPNRSRDKDDVIDEWMDAETMRTKGYVQLTGKEAFRYYCSRIAKELENALIQKYTAIAKWGETVGND